MKTNRGWNSNIHCRPLITFCLILMLALSACSNTVKQPVKADKVEQMEELNSTRDGIHILRGVCEVSWRCVAEGPGDWLIEELLRLPMLATGKQGGNPTERLERAVRQAVKSLARDRRYADLSRKKQLEVLAGMVAREYRARLSATLQDSLHEMAEREKSPYGPENSSEHITISSFNIDIVDSWTKGPTFLLEVRASIENGPPTHSRIRCDQCESFPTDADRWTPYEFWNPSVILVGEGRLTVCLEVRAEPYYGNYANTAIACDTIGAPSAQQLEDEKLKAAAI
ncbi:MAG: hypothetical protein ACE5GF_09980, partial [Thermodesulfobacteriota bacterium]